jgi:hypothetical protein
VVSKNSLNRSLSSTRDALFESIKLSRRWIYACLEICEGECFVRAGDHDPRLAPHSDQDLMYLPPDSLVFDHKDGLCFYPRARHRGYVGCFSDRILKRSSR